MLSYRRVHAAHVVLDDVGDELRSARLELDPLDEGDGLAVRPEVGLRTRHWLGLARSIISVQACQKNKKIKKNKSRSP